MTTTAPKHDDDRPEAWAGDTIPELKIEPCEDGTIVLEQEWAGNVDRVAVHHIHLRYIAEKLGMLPQLATSDGELLRAQAVRIQTVESDRSRLRRTLLCLRDRADRLHKNICLTADMGHEDLTTEVVQATALVDMLDLVCEDFEDEFAVLPRAEEPPPAARPRKTSRRVALEAASLDSAAGQAQPSHSETPPAGSDLFAGGASA